MGGVIFFFRGYPPTPTMTNNFGVELDHIFPFASLLLSQLDKFLRLEFQLSAPALSYRVWMEWGWSGGGVLKTAMLSDSALLQVNF